MKRLKLGPKTLTAAGCLVAGGLGVYLYARSETRRFRLESVDITTGFANDNGDAGSAITSDKLASRRLLSLRILHLSDLHLHYPESHKIDFVKRITDDDYDLIVFTGDVFENYSGLEYASELVTRRPRYGSYAVLGNHDYYDYNMLHKTLGRLWRKHRHPSEFRNVEPMIAALRDAGIQTLRNEAITIGPARTHLIGIDYPGIAEAQLMQLSAQSPPDHMIMALLHVPHNLHSLPKAGIHLALGGHTHGGQIRFPGVGALITDSELHRSEASGLVWRGNTALHISRGLGAQPNTNVRLFCPPAATVLNVLHQI